MNELLYSPKIKPDHLARKAIIYLRQSSEKQVRQNIESQRLQYDMAERIRGLGWQEIEIINCDLGASAAMGSASREGFERVLSSVALGNLCTSSLFAA
jgi:DNA invertase Pin-like site-specific DNA recombinase